MENSFPISMKLLGLQPPKQKLHMYRPVPVFRNTDHSDTEMMLSALYRPIWSLQLSSLVIGIPAAVHLQENKYPKEIHGCSNTTFVKLFLF